MGRAGSEASSSTWRGNGAGTAHAPVRAAIDHLADSGAHRHFALSYHPDNTVARRLYANLGFVETGEMAEDELVARLNLDANG
jgi:diamine N-acetyltransferase